MIVTDWSVSVPMVYRSTMEAYAAAELSFDGGVTFSEVGPEYGDYFSIDPIEIPALTLPAAATDLGFSFSWVSGGLIVPVVGSGTEAFLGVQAIVASAAYVTWLMGLLESGDPTVVTDLYLDTGTGPGGDLDPGGSLHGGACYAVAGGTVGGPTASGWEDGSDTPPLGLVSERPAELVVYTNRIYVDGGAAGLGGPYCGSPSGEVHVWHEYSIEAQPGVTTTVVTAGPSTGGYKRDLA